MDAYDEEAAVRAVEGMVGAQEHGGTVDDVLFWRPLVMSLIAGGATGLGALVVLCMGKGRPDNRHMSFSLSMAAGVMITVSVFDMYIPTLASRGFFLPTISAMFGALLFKCLLSLVPSPESLMLPTAMEAGGASFLRRPSSNEKYKRREKQWRLGVILLIVLTLHNLPEGLAVSAAIQAQHQNIGDKDHARGGLGIVVTFAIALHNVFEGLILAVPLYAATNSRKYAIGMAFMSGLSEPLGSLIGLVFLRSYFSLYPSLVEYLLCGVSGIMVAVSFYELLPEARTYNHQPSFRAGLIIGSFLMLVSIWLQPEE